MTEVNTMATLQEQLAQRNAESESKVNSIYDKQLAAQQQSLTTAHNQNLSDMEAEKAKIAPTYQTSANDLAVQYERNRRNLNEQAMSRGLNTGTASQQQLAVNQAFMKNYGKLRGEEAAANTEAERQITNLKVNYQAQMQQALADNDYKRAAALMDEYNNNRTWYDTQLRYEQQQQLEKAETLASYGDFSGYAAIYGAEQAAAMKEMWIAQNPLLAYNTGVIDANRYRNITGENPPGYVAPSSGGGGGGGYYGGGTSSNNSKRDINLGPGKELKLSGVFSKSGSSSASGKVVQGASLASSGFTGKSGKF